MRESVGRGQGRLGISPGDGTIRRGRLHSRGDRIEGGVGLAPYQGGGGWGGWCGVSVAFRRLRSEVGGGSARGFRGQ